MTDKTITIVSKKDGWRRAGVKHPAAPTKHAPEAFTKDEWDQIKADPMLIVYAEGQAPAAPAGEDVTRLQAENKALGEQVKSLGKEKADLEKQVADLTKEKAGLEKDLADNAGSSPNAGGGGATPKAAGSPASKKGGGK